MKRSARHHWWPKSLSQYWTDEKGHIHRIDCDGKDVPSTPQTLARISGGHNIVFDNPSPWDESFESYFDRPDGNFPTVVRWLEEIVASHIPAKKNQAGPYFCPHECGDDDLLRLFECMLSLAIRSPRFRSGAVQFAESLRGSIEKSEQKRLAAANLRQSYSILTNDLWADGKYVLFFIPERKRIFSKRLEFIFGDGFYHNLNVATQNLFGVKMLLPLTPSIAVLHTRPMQYNPAPRLMTSIADPNLVKLFNETMQIYSKDCLFYRSAKPKLSEHFTTGEYLRFDRFDPIDELIHTIPGVPAPANDLPF